MTGWMVSMTGWVVSHDWVGGTSQLSVHRWLPCFERVVSKWNVNTERRLLLAIKYYPCLFALDCVLLAVCHVGRALTWALLGHFAVITEASGCPWKNNFFIGADLFWPPTPPPFLFLFLNVGLHTLLVHIYKSLKYRYAGLKIHWSCSYVLSVCVHLCVHVHMFMTGVCECACLCCMCVCSHVCTQS